MQATMTKEERVIQAYGFLKRALKRYRRSVSLPTNTDPTKTYSWRYLERFIDRFDALGLDDESLEVVIEAIVEHAHKSGDLCRGIAILDQKNIINIVLAKLEADIKSEENITKTIEESDRFVRQQLPEGSAARVLLSQRPNRTAYSNITRWYKANQISIGYIAVSRECKKALGTLPQHELQLFPQPTDLLRMRLRLISRQNIVTKLKTTMGSDLVED